MFMRSPARPRADLSVAGSPPHPYGSFRHCDRPAQPGQLRRLCGGAAAAFDALAELTKSHVV
jgi:hypothetical protein